MAVFAVQRDTFQQAAEAGDDPMELHRCYHRSRDPRLREALVHRYAVLVRRLARRFAYRGEEFDDLVQVAFGGLLVAIDRFDPERGRPFVSFATPTIVGELKRHFRDRRWNVRVPRSTQENYLRVREATDRLSQELGRSPTPADIARFAGLSDDDVNQALQAANSFRPLPIDDPDDDQDSWLQRRLAGPCPELQSAENRQVAAGLIGRLPERHQRIVRLRFGHELSQNEIAQRLGVSQMQVSRLLRQSLESMRDADRRR